LDSTLRDTYPQATREQSVSVGVLFPTATANPSEDIDLHSLLRFAEMTEKQGFDSLWIGDSFLHRLPFDPVVLLAGAAALTQTILLGTVLLFPALRNPVSFAQTVSSLHGMAKGRFILGIGGGISREKVLVTNDITLENRFRRMAATLDLAKRLWEKLHTGKEIFPAPTQSASCHRLAASSLSLPDTCSDYSGPPVWMEGQSQSVLRHIGSHYDGWFHNSPSPEAYTRRLQDVQKAALTTGRPRCPTPAFYATVHIDENTQRARTHLDDFIRSICFIGTDILQEHHACFSGGVNACADWLSQYVEAGTRHIVLHIGSRNTGPQMESLLEVRSQLLQAGTSTVTQQKIRGF